MQKYVYRGLLLIVLFFLETNAAEGKMELWHARCYDANSQLQKTIAHNFLHRISQQFTLPEGGCLLDIGCGPGRVTASILEVFPQAKVIGIDASEDMINFAKANFASSRITFSLDRAEELKSIQAESIDAVVSFSCLHWVMDQEAAFQKIWTVLKLGGWAGLMFVAETGYEDPIDAAYAQATAENPWQSYFQNKDLQEVNWNTAKLPEIKTQLEKIGFHIVSMDVQNFAYYFESPAMFRNWVLASSQQLKLLPNNLQESCAQRIVDLYLNATSQHNVLDEKCFYRVDACTIMMTK